MVVLQVFKNKSVFVGPVETC